MEIAEFRAQLVASLDPAADIRKRFPTYDQLLQFTTEAIDSFARTLQAVADFDSEQRRRETQREIAKHIRPGAREIDDPYELVSLRLAHEKKYGKSRGWQTHARLHFKVSVRTIRATWTRIPAAPYFEVLGVFRGELSGWAPAPGPSGMQHARVLMQKASDGKRELWNERTPAWEPHQEDCFLILAESKALSPEALYERRKFHPVLPMAQDPDVHALHDAEVFAEERHRDQRRKDAETSPYITHPRAVAHLLFATGVKDVDVLRAALLHDTVEDTETTEAELRERFGDAVASMVMEVTDDKTLPKERRKELQIEHAPHLSNGAALVKLADKTCNLRDVANAPPVDWSLKRRQEYFEWAKRVVDRLPPVNDVLLRSFADAYANKPDDENTNSEECP